LEGDTPGLGELIEKIRQNFELVQRIRGAGDWEEAERLSEELERRLGIPVYWDENWDDVTPALVINTDRQSNVVMWLDISEEETLRFTDLGYIIRRVKR